MPAEYALLETVQRTRAALLEQTNLSPDELRERLYATMRDEVELHQRRAAAANDPLLADPADTEQWLEDHILGYGDLGPLMRTDGIQTIRIMGPAPAVRRRKRSTAPPRGRALSERPGGA